MAYLCCALFSSNFLLIAALGFTNNWLCRNHLSLASFSACSVCAACAGVCQSMASRMHSSHFFALFPCSHISLLLFRPKKQIGSCGAAGAADMQLGCNGSTRKLRHEAVSCMNLMKLPLKCYCFAAFQVCEGQKREIAVQDFCGIIMLP